MLLVVTAGQGLFWASAWVSFVSIHTVPSYLAYTFPFEPFILSLAGQALGLVLALSGKIRFKALPLFSRPVTILAFCLVYGLSGVVSFTAANHIEVQLGSIVSGFTAVPLVFAWGVFLSNQQPRFSALAVSASFVLGCVISYGIELTGYLGILAAIALLPVCSAVLWLVSIKLSNQERDWTKLIRSNFTDVLDLERQPVPGGQARAEGQSLPGARPRPAFRQSLLALMGHNPTLPVFTVCAFFIYLMEQFVFSGNNNPPGYKMVTIGVGLAVLLTFLVFSGLGKRKDPDTLWPLFIFLIFAALLTIPFLWGTNSDVAANISIVASRSLSTFTWIVLVTTISRYSLEPFRAFGIGMLVVSQLPWLLAFAVSMALAALAPQLTENTSMIALILAILLMGGVTVQTMLLYAQNQKADRERRERRERPQLARAETAAGRLLVSDGINGNASESDSRSALAMLAKDHHLTGREAEVIGLMLVGRTLPEIADQFVLSINTVRTHYGHAYQKLAVNKKRELFDLFESYLESAATKRQPVDNDG